MNRAILMLGSNVGNSVQYLQEAKENIQKKAGNIALQSCMYKTAPWGNENQHDYLNQALELETELDSKSLLHLLLEIEQEAGRIRIKKNDPRTLDIDILFFNDEIMESGELILPHPRLHERNFVLVPLMEIIPDFVHPKLLQTISGLHKICTDTLTVHKLS